ncbi:hypothetical protein GGR54DRAFT_583445 [Hypoxylon sp. NC1633]|nr:hypothetical protein GGR54DRAFT_583445 [Hypoxylon sp. NC1633]
MEALVAVGLASNVLQFVDFTSKLVSKANELRKDAAFSEHRDHAAIAAHLRALAVNVKASAQSIVQASTTASLEEKTLQPVADGCCDLAAKLLKRLGDIGLLSTQNDSILRRGKVAWRWVWNKQEIDEIANRLHYFGSQLALHITYQIRQNQNEQRACQSSKDDIQNVLTKLNEIMPSVEDLRLSVHEKLDRHHTDVLNSLTDLRSQSSQLQKQVTQETFSTAQTLTGRIGDMETSVGAMILDNREDMKAYHSSIQESLATIQVQNTEFHANATQVSPQASYLDTASFQVVLKSMFDEHQEKLLSEVRKEFRGTARDEMESLRTQSLQALGRIQSGLQANGSQTKEDCFHARESYSYCEIQNRAETSARESTPDSQEYHRQRKSSLTMFKRFWVRYSRIGTFRLAVQNETTFDPIMPPVSVYRLSVQFTPSLRWFSRGACVTYQSVTDARGGPRFGVQFESYRVLDDDDHEAWKAIRNGDVDSIRNMLSQRVLFPSDRKSYGWTLLDYAVFCGRLEIVKTLVQSGADINAVDGGDLSVITKALCPDRLYDNDEGIEIFNYLRGLPGILLTDLWQNIYAGIFIIVRFKMVFVLNADKIEEALSNLVTMGRSVEFDFDIEGELSFLGQLITVVVGLNWDHTDAITIFDKIMNYVTKTDTHISSTIPVYLAATFLIKGLERESILSMHEPTNCPYCGSFISHNFFVHVIMRGIAQRPDCVFDSDDDVTISDMFRDEHHKEIWDEILESSGLDPDWVREEDERRKRVVTGGTTAHEVSVGTDAAQVLDVQRRRGHTFTEE